MAPAACGRLWCGGSHASAHASSSWSGLAAHSMPIGSASRIASPMRADRQSLETPPALLAMTRHCPQRDVAPAPTCGSSSARSGHACHHQRGSPDTDGRSRAEACHIGRRTWAAFLLPSSGSAMRLENAHVALGGRRLPLRLDVLRHEDVDQLAQRGGAAHLFALRRAGSAPRRTPANSLPATFRASSGVISSTEPIAMRFLATPRPPPCGRYSTIRVFLPVGHDAEAEALQILVIDDNRLVAGLDAGKFAACGSLATGIGFPGPWRHINLVATECRARELYRTDAHQNEPGNAPNHTGANDANLRYIAAHPPATES